MNSRHQHGQGAGFGGLGGLEDQIFGPNGLLGQVLGNQGSAGGWPGGGARHGGPRPGPGGDRRRARRGDVRNAVLHLLGREPMNGYQLMQEIAQSSGGAWQPSSGAIYPALAQLEDEGLVAQTEVDGRRAYRLTDEGRVAADALPPQGWASEEDTAGDDAWGEQVGGPGRGGPGSGGRGGRGGPGRAGRAGPGGPGRDHEHASGRSGGWAAAGRSNGTLLKALGSVALAAQAVGQVGDQDLSRQAADLLDRTRRDLYRMLAETEVAKDNDDHHEDDEITEAEILDEG